MSQPIAKRVPGGYQLLWSQEGLRASVKRITDDRRGGTHGEVTFTSIQEPNPGHMFRLQANLLTDAGKKSIVRALRDCDGTSATDWTSLTEQLCKTVVDMHRLGEPIVEIGDLPFRDSTAYRLDPIIPEGQPAIIFGPGGTFKSYFALLVAVLVQTGTVGLGLTPKQGNVMIVDFETSYQEINERLQAICRGLEHAPVRIPYRFCSSALEDDIEAIQDAVNERQIDLLIVDSLGPACGADPNAADSIIRLFNALRGTKATCLLIDHVAKNANTPTPFGSVYKINLARSVWELKRVSTPTGIRIGLYHRKCNEGPLRKPLGFEIEFLNDKYGRAETVRMAPFHVKEDQDLSLGLPLKERILNVLQGGKCSNIELADRLNDSPATVRARCNDLAKQGKVQRDPNNEEYWELTTDAIPF